MAPSCVNTAFVVRHGERLDHVSRVWEPDPTHGLPDPPLSDKSLFQKFKGYAQAERTGSYLVDLMQESGIDPDTTMIVIYTSPFQRCIDTALAMAQHFPPCNTVLRLEIGLGEWMSDEFFSEPPCPASRLVGRHHEALARRQLASYKSGTPLLQVDYGHRSSCTDFNHFPEEYSSMVRRLNDARLHCLRESASASTKASVNDHREAVTVFVTHAICVNILLDGFRAKLTRPKQAGYCTVSRVRKRSACVSPTSSADEESSSYTPLTPSSSIHSANDDGWIIDLLLSDTHLSL